MLLSSDSRIASGQIGALAGIIEGDLWNRDTTLNVLAYQAWHSDPPSAGRSVLVTTLTMLISFRHFCFRRSSISTKEGSNTRRLSVRDRWIGTGLFGEYLRTPILTAAIDQLHDQETGDDACRD